MNDLSINRYGRLNFFEKLYFGREEMRRNQTFIDNYVKLLLSMGGYGIVSKDHFEVTRGSNPGTIKINKSLAVDINGNLIFKEEQDNIVIPTNGSYWISISYTPATIEEGVLSISNTGEVTGIGTKFTDLLRGLLSYKQTRIKFYKQDGSLLRNDQMYTVAEVVNDTNIVLSGSFVQESNLRYTVIGTFEKDIIPAVSEIYSIDGCLLQRHEGSAVQIPSNSGIDNKTIFTIAHVTNSNGQILIQDKREKFYSYLKELVEPQEWIDAHSYGNGVFESTSDPIRTRFISNNYMFEIKGRYHTNTSVGDILCILDERFWPEEEQYLMGMDQEGRTFPLKITTTGRLEHVGNEQISNTDSTMDNIIINHIVSLR